MSTVSLRSVEQDELLDLWTLSREDVAVVAGARGADNRLFSAASLCVLRATGAFPGDWSTIPLAVVNHLARQLRMSPQLLPVAPQRRATLHGLRRRIREHLGFAPYTEEVGERLEHALRQQLEAVADTGAALGYAEEVLREWKVVRPAQGTLDRLVGGLVRRVTDELCDTAVAGARDSDLLRLDELLVASGSAPSALGRLKQVRAGKPMGAFLEGVKLFGLLSPLVGTAVSAQQLPEAWRLRLARVARQADASALRRHRRTVRLAALACFVAIEHRNLLDELVELYDSLVSQACSRAHAAARKEEAKAMEDAKKSAALLAAAMDQILSQEDANTARQKLCEEVGEERLRRAVASCRKLAAPDKDAFVIKMRRRYAGLRRFLPSFYRLPLCAEQGSEKLVEAVAMARGPQLPDDPPSRFLQPAFRRHLVDEEGRVVRAVWETGLAIALRDALRRGDVYLSGAHQHSSRTDSLFDDDTWSRVGPEVRDTLELPEEPQPMLDELDDLIAEHASSLAESLATNPVVSIRGGKLRVGSDRPKGSSRRVQALRKALRANVPQVRIEKLLLELDATTGFARHLVPEDSMLPVPSRSARLAALLAEGTNLGVGALTQSLEGVDARELERASRSCLSIGALTEANRCLVNAITQYTYDPDHGEHVRTSSDAQRFPVARRSRLSGHFPPRHGFHQRSLKLYGHQVRGAIFATRVLACTEVEALYVVDALLDPGCPISTSIHHTDTHGATLVLFGLCHLLGIELRPWLADPASRQLFRALRAGGQSPSPLSSWATSTER